MAELATLERLLDEKERLKLYLELIEANDIAMVKRLIASRIATIESAVDAK